MRRSRVNIGVAILFAVLSSGCLYQFRGGSFPDHLRTLAIEPVENETTRLELTGEIQDQLRDNLPRALGIRSAGSERADATVVVRITRYEVIAPNYRSGARGQPAEVLQRQVMITAQAQIVDQVMNQVYWEENSLRADGQFLEGTEAEEVGRAEAIERLVQKIVDGAQSNW